MDRTFTAAIAEATRPITMTATHRPGHLWPPTMGGTSLGDGPAADPRSRCLPNHPPLATVFRVLNLAGEIQDARLKYEALAKRFIDLDAQLNDKTHYLSPAHYSAATRELRAQLIGVQKEIESTAAFIE